jgi:hypothetical protein
MEEIDQDEIQLIIHAVFPQTVRVRYGLPKDVESSLGQIQVSEKQVVMQAGECRGRSEVPRETKLQANA